VNAGLAVRWLARDEPLPARAVVGAGPSARRLAASLLARDDASLARLRGVAAAEWIAVEGDAEDLPWADGVVYLGRDPEAPSLLVPTRARPSVPAAWLEQALRRTHAQLLAPIAVVDAPAAVLSLASARAIARSHVARWLAGPP
jgi:hypothetical protein